MENSKLWELKFYAITKYSGMGVQFFTNGDESNVIEKVRITSNTTKSNFVRLMKAIIVNEIKSTKYGNKF